MTAELLPSAAPTRTREAGFASGNEDPRVLAALEEYLSAGASGTPVPREEFLQRFPEIASELAACLEGLQFVQGVARDLRSGSEVATRQYGLPLEPIGDFRLLREIGRGGMGVVYEAEQISLKRRVALKVLPLASTLDSRHLQRFKNESLAAAHLHHPHIVPVYAVGCERGVHFYAMQFIEGQSLAGLIEELRKLEPANTVRSKAGRTMRAVVSATDDLQAPTDLDVTQDFTPGQASRTSKPTTGTHQADDTPGPAAAFLSTARTAKDAGYCRNAARLALQAAEALEHAHQQGVIHRDIKPANLLLDARGELWIADFGLAQIQSDTQLTMTGDIVGTLRYMSPEQALGKGAALDHRTDVYALGATLYELLTLAPAVGGNDRQELLRRLAFDEPVAPRRLNRTIPAELETIVLKALAKEPAERYATAQDLADDLRRFLDDQPIWARPPTVSQRLTRFARRHRGLVATTVVCVVVGLATAAALLTLKNREISREQAKTNAALTKELDANNRLTAALAREKEAKDNLQAALTRELAVNYQQRIWLAAREIKAGNIEQARAFLDECPENLRHWEWHYLNRQCAQDTHAIRAWPANKKQFAAELTYSSDGVKLVCAHTGGFLVADARTGKELWIISNESHKTTGAAFHPQGKVLATTDTRLRVWDAERGRELAELAQQQGVFMHPRFSADGRHLAVLSRGKVEVWDWQKQQLVKSLPMGRDVAPLVKHVYFPPVFSAQGRRLTFNLEDRLEVFDWEAEKSLGSLPVKLENPIFAACQDGSKLAVREKLDVLSIWDGQTCRKLATLALPAGATARDLAFSPDGQLLAAACTDERLRLWQAATGDEFLSLRAHPGGYVSRVAFSPSGERLATFGGDGLVKLWSVDNGDELRRYGQAALEPAGLQFSPDERQLAIAYRSGILRLCEATPLETSVSSSRASGKQPPAPRDERVAFSPNLDRLATATEGRIFVRDTNTRELLHSLAVRGGYQQVQQLRFSQDGKRLVAISRRPTPAIAPRDGDQPKLLVPGAAINVFDCQTGASLGLQALFSRLEKSTQLAIDPAGNFLAFASGPSLSIVELESRRKLQTWKQESDILATAFHPREPRCATGGEDGLVRIWDVATGQVRLTLEGHRGPVAYVGFSPQGDKLVSVGQDRGVCLWNLDSENMLARIETNTDESFILAFSNDGRRLATANVDLTVSIRDTATGQELVALSGATGPIVRLAFSADGERLAAAFERGSIKTWDTNPPEPETVARQQAAIRNVWHTRQAEQWLRKEQLLGAAWHLGRLLADQPDDAKLRNQRTRCLLQAGAWEQIDAADAETLVLDPLRDEDRALGYQAAYLFVSRGHADAYQRLCRSFQDASDKESNAFRQSVMLRLCIVGPGVGEPQRLIDQTRAALASYRDPFVFHYTLGGTLYRAGQFEAAAAELEQAAKQKTGAEAQILTWLLLALARHQLGAADEAGKWLAKADEWIAKVSEGQALETVPVPGVSLRSALVFPLLRAEARLLMGK